MILKLSQNSELRPTH